MKAKLDMYIVLRAGPYRDSIVRLSEGQNVEVTVQQGRMLESSLRLSEMQQWPRLDQAISKSIEQAEERETIKIERSYYKLVDFTALLCVSAFIYLQHCVGYLWLKKGITSLGRILREGLNVSLYFNIVRSTEYGFRRRRGSTTTAMRSPSRS